MAVTIKGNVVRMTAAGDVYRGAGKLKINCVRLVGSDAASATITNADTGDMLVRLATTTSSLSDTLNEDFRTDEAIKLNTLTGTTPDVFVYLE